MRLGNKHLFNRTWEIYTRFINRYALWIVIFFVVVSCGAWYYTINNIGVNSDTADMFDSSLPFRQQKDQFDETFPLSHHNIVIVVDAQYPEAADSLSMVLADKLRKRPSLFQNVYVPGGEDFFKKNQLLFLGTDKLEELSGNLARSQVLFSLLAQNYSLRGFFSFLDQVVSMGNEEQIGRLNRLLGQINYTIQAYLHGNSYTMSWQQTMSSSELEDNQNLRLILVKPYLDYDQLNSAKPAIETIRDIIDGLETKDTSIHITGNVAMAYEELQSVMNGTIIAGILAFILVGLTLWVGLRSFRLISSAIITLLAGLSLTTAFSAFAVGQLNMISVAFAVLYIGLGIDYAIHFTLKFNEHILDDKTPFDALQNTFKELSAALALSTLSTALGFYAFIPTSFSGISELGIIAGTGMFISLVATFTLLPALLRLFYGPVRKTSQVTLAAPFADQISSLQIRYAPYIRGFSILAGIVSLILLFEISFDYNPINLRNPKTESVATMNKLMNSEAFTPWTVELMADDSSETMQKVHQLRELEPVGSVVTLFSFIPDNQQDKLPLIRPLKSRYLNIPAVTRDSASYSLKNQIEAVKNFRDRLKNYSKTKTESMETLQGTLDQLLDSIAVANPSLQNRLLKQVESGLLKTFPSTLQNLKHSVRAESVTVDSIPNFLRERWKSDQGTYRIEVTPAAGYDNTNAERRQFASAIQDYSTDATGNLITIIESGDTVKYAFLEAITYSLIVIVLMLVAYFRSLKDILYVLLPITLAGMMTCAAMVILNLQFNFANIIALPLLLGLGVDNGIHIVHRAHTDSLARKNMLKSSTARAIYFSALTTLFSFGNLAFSPHTGTASMGIILTVGLLFILFTTLIVLPAFLIKREGRH